MACDLRACGLVVTSVLGVDPTATGTGAAVLRVDGVVVAWWCWTLTARGWRIRSDVPECVYPGTPLEGIGYVVGCDVQRRVGRVSLVVEGLFVPPRWARTASGADVIALAEATGRTIAGLARCCGEPGARPTKAEWSAPYGLGKLASKAQDDAVLAMARREGWLPRVSVAEQVSVAEAGVMARWPVSP